MEIPKQVDEAADLATQLHEQMFTPQAPVEPEVIDPPDDNQPAPEANTDEEPDVPHDDDIEELRKFKERYLHLKGKYDAEVPRLNNELKEFKQTVFERLEAQVKQTPTENTEQPVDKFAKFKEEYGEDLFEAIKELAGIQAEERLNTRIKPVEDQVSSVEDTQIKTAQQNFVNYLDTKVTGDWKKLWNGEDPKFLEFLEKPDPSGLYTYGDLVKAYNDNWDADRLSTVFNLYLKENTPVAPKTSNPTKDAMVAPSRQTTHTTPSINDKRIWTTAAMQEFQQKDAKGLYTPEESKAMWDDLLAAPSENRFKN